MIAEGYCALGKKQEMAARLPKKARLKYAKPQAKSRLHDRAFACDKQKYGQKALKARTRF
ncbi:hypothetical protein L6R21_04390 [bacterium]|nr:hypothetical protein [bacterium]